MPMPMKPNALLAPVPPESTPKAQKMDTGAGLDLKAMFRKFIELNVANGDATARTIAAYSESLQHFLGWCVRQNHKPMSMSHIDLMEYRKRLTVEFQISTVRLRLHAVRLLFEALQKFGKRNDNPAAGLKSPRIRTERTEAVKGKALSIEEARLLWQATHGNTIAAARDRAIIALMMFHGLRAKEICLLHVTSLDAHFNRLAIFGKGAKIRHLELCPHSRTALMDWLRFRLDIDRNCGGHPWPLFYRLDWQANIGDDHGHLTVRTIERIVDAALKRLELKKPGRSAHSLRHTYAILSVMGGASREILADSMGHSSMATTDIYIRAAASVQDNPADAVSKMIQGGSTE